MKTKTKKIAIVLVLLLAILSGGNAQISVMSNYIYQQDSIAGFDEKAASAGALANGCYGNEYKVYMYKAKRVFVQQKYNLKTTSSTPLTLFQNSAGAPASVLPGGACNNEDFELATSNVTAPNAVQGWSLQSGTNNNSCQTPVLTGTSFYTVFTSPVTDSRLPSSVGSYFDASSNTTPSGNAFIRLNDDNAGGKAVRLTKSFIPTANSALFQYAYLPVIEDGSHGCCDQAGFNIKITITNTATSASTILACPNISVAVPGAACSFTPPPGSPTFSPCVGNQGINWSYTNWTASAIDLTQYINFQVTLDITIVDCAFGGHGAYCYFDAKCSPMTITGNGNPFPAGTPSVTLPTCGAAGATICATPGLGPYSWAGQGVVPPFNTPSMSNQCFTSSLSTTYTLYMNPPGSCAPIARIINTTITAAPLLLASIVQAGCGGNTAVITVTPSGSATNPSYINWSPTPLSLNSQTTIGTYGVASLTNTQVVTVTASDPLGCIVTQTLGVAPPPPFPTFTIVNTSGTPSITCATPTINLDAQTTYTYGTLNYFWASNSLTFTTNQISVTTPGTYTCLITDPVTNCQNVKTVAIGLNTAPPLSAVSPSVQNINCALPTPITVTATANPSVNITHNVLSPFGASVSATSNTMIYVPACGVYTHVLINDVNGCVTTKLFTVTCAQGFPTFNVSSAQNFTLGCNSTSCAAISIDNGNTDPAGGPVSYTILPPSSSSVTPPGVLSGQSVYTVCAPGTYTVVTKDNSTFCETRIPVSILLNTALPNISAIVERQILDCNNPKVKLKGISTTNGVEYMWNFIGSPNTQQGDTITALINSAATTSSFVNSFTLNVTNQSSTCRSTSVIPIFQSLYRPNAIVTNGGTSALTCVTPSAVLTNQSSTTIPPSTGFPANLPAVASWVGPTPQEPKENATTYTAVTTGVYTMTAKDLNNGCISTATVLINDNRNYPDLSGTIKTWTLDCGEKSTKIKVVPTSPTNLTYSWTSPAAATIAINTLGDELTTQNIGEYVVRANNSNNGCSSKINITVVNGNLIADFEPDKITGFAPLTVNFTNNSKSDKGNNNIISRWNFGNGSSKTYSFATETASALFTQAGTYTVTLFANKGTCIESKQRIITVDIPSSLVIPNVFTPNGDGVNDFFFLKSTNLIEINAKIIDRWGKIVYEVTSSTGNISWDGKNQFGKDVAEGTYFYIIKSTGNDGMEYNTKGTVNLFR